MRGDANMSDSRFMKSQKIVSKKLQKDIDKLDKEYRMREMRERWESGKGKYVIVNNDHQVGLKGSKQFMDDNARLRIVRALYCVDKAMVSVDEDGTVVRSIAQIHKRYADDPFVTGIYFMNGGDRKEGNTPESEFCQQNDIYLLYNVGGNKTESSSTLLQKVKDGK